MEYKALERLYQIQLKNSKDQTWVNKDLYRLLYKKDLYLYIYKKSHLDFKNRTKNFSSRILKQLFLTKLQNLVLDMRTNSFEFRRLLKVGKQVVIIPHPLSYLVQKVVKLILEEVYYSMFIKSTYCNVQDKSYGKNIENFSTDFETSVWFFRNLRELNQYTINSEVLSSLLKRRIQDFRFIQLIIKYLSGISLSTNKPRNNLLFPILINIYLYELDFFVKTLREKYTNLEAKWKRRLIQVYSNLIRKISLLERSIVNNYDPNTIQILSKQLLILKREKFHFITYKNANSSFKITYVRYHTDWILGITGNSTILEEIKKEVVSFLKNFLKLDFSLEKNTALHFKNYKSSFLNYHLSIVSLIKKYRFKTYLEKTYYKRMSGNLIKLDIPLDCIISQLSLKGFCNLQGIPVMKKSWIVQSDMDIIKAYSKTFHRTITSCIGLANQDTLKRIQYIIKHSCVCTLAYKHKSTIKKIYCLYGAKLTLNFIC